MPGRTRDPTAKRGALLDAADESIAAHGYEGSSTASIAAAAGVSEGIVFHHFGSKHGLLEGCSARMCEDFATGELRRHRDGLDYRRLIVATFDWVASSVMIARLWTEGDDRVVGALRRGMERGIVHPVAAALEAEQVAGRCRAGDPLLFARLQFGVVGEALIAHFAEPERWPRTLVVDETVRAVTAIVHP